LLFALVAAVPGVWLGCSSSSPEVSDQTIDDAGADASSDGATKSDATDAAASDATADATSSTDAGDSGSFTGPPIGDASCNPSAAWGTGTLLAASTSTDDLLDAITPDELTIAWTEGASGARFVYYADRTSASSAFGSPQNLGQNNFTADRVALSPDGLRIVVVNADAHGFSEAKRGSRAGTFGAFSEGGFTNINADVAAGASVGDPLIGETDTQFYFSVYGTSSTTTIYRSLRLTTSDPWGNGGALDVASGLLEVGSNRRRPTGISSDGRTLFFYDQVSSTERAAWINEGTGVFDSIVDLGARNWAAPSSSCGSLYYSSAGASSIDLFTATH
jgi:hypothetical protein